MIILTDVSVFWENSLELMWVPVLEIITKDQLYKICHISKSTALYLLKSGKIPCEYNGKKTRFYKIKKDDVIKNFWKPKRFSRMLFRSCRMIQGKLYCENGNWGSRTGSWKYEAVLCGKWIWKLIYEKDLKEKLKIKNDINWK